MVSLLNWNNWLCHRFNYRGLVYLKKKKPEPEFLPVVEGAKIVGKAAAKGAGILADSIFPSHASNVRREEKRLRLLEQEIKLLELRRKRERLLKKLKEAQE
jgi:hypothetical protein